MTEQQFPQHPRVTETMDLINHAMALYDRLIEAQNTNSTTATDSTKTVAVTVNHFRWLTGVWIAPGTRTIGAAAFNKRLAEALANANALAQESADAIEAEHTRELDIAQRKVEEMVARYEGAPPSAVSAPVALPTLPTATPAASNDRW
ncbi:MULTISPECIES: hypothetical protein [Mycolicibacterium]|uniref:ESX-1 secretion-associated protein EspL n=1 Tax=Mycolicibacterium alvei TaxID=67081 RepID=A0A6N4V2A3_9MYCO|nr:MULTISPECIES: hypothetical protein [Mycolicibacterium]MCV6998662.1 hypothetical protein [Mycolicibacterium alvei]OBG12286.1 hypothetical protein A5768_11205 [Mycolicibacterium fortuitum]BBX30678.1 hypothetical protein MALV_58030 [Mycolicibacterium alvei]